MPAPITLEDAKRRLKTETVGFGEDHSKPTAREAIYDLIKQPGLVKELVLELGEPWEDRGILGFEYRGVVTTLDGKWNNSFSLTKLIQASVLKGIYIHCWDPGDKYNLSQNKNTTNRNKEIANKFKEFFKKNADNAVNVPGCIILLGSHHFNLDEGSLDSLIPKLGWVDLSK